MSTITTAEYREQLNKGLETLTNSEGWERWLRFRSTQHSYSWSNTLLALLQHPTASLIRGYGAKDGSTGWLAVGRQVRKGEKAIRIFAPVLVTKDKGTADERKVLVSFRLVNVFDVDQTDGDPIPDIGISLPEGEAPVGLLDSLVSLAEAQGITVSFTTPEKGEGYLDIVGKRIVVKDDNSPAAQVKTMIHELAHWFDLSGHENPMMEYVLHRGDAEAVAESVAFVVSRANGIETDNYSFGYIASWVGGDLAKVKDLAGRVDKAAQVILRALEGTEATEVAEEGAAA